jgi:predicted acylesterase/phospholipase RssA
MRYGLESQGGARVSHEPRPIALSRAPGGAPRRSLVLGGGGARAAYQAGAMRALQEVGLGFDHVDATSTGTLNLALLLSGLDPAAIAERWCHPALLGLPCVAAPRLFDGKPGWARSSGDSLAQLGRAGVDLAAINAANGIEGTFNLADMTTLTQRVISHRALRAPELVASVSLAGLMPPVSIDDAEHGDAAWMQGVNLREAVQRGAEEIWLIWCVGGGSGYDAREPWARCLEMTASGALGGALAQIAELNQRIARGDSPWGQRAPIRLKVIKPEYPLPLGPSDPVGADDTRRLVELGYADAWRRASRSQQDDALDPSATRLGVPEAAIAFSERFTGLVSAVSPASAPARAPAGGQARPTLPGDSRIELTLSVFVHQLARFLNEPERGAPLAGSVLWGGAWLPLRAGEFRADAALATGLRRLTYRAEFQPPHAEAPLWVWIERRPRERSGAQQPDVGELHVSICEGPSPGSAAVARGVLESSVDEVSQSCRTLQALEPESPRDAARAIVQLGRFLFSELYDVCTARPWWKVW